MGFISSFKELAVAFVDNFKSQQVSRRPIENLLAVKQRPGETLRDYLNRYRKEVAQADRYDDKIASQGLLNGVRNDHPVAWALTVDTPRTFLDLYDKVLKYAESKKY